MGKYFEESYRAMSIKTTYLISFGLIEFAAMEHIKQRPACDFPTWKTER